ncbi:mucin-3A [Stegastes partitus]|uniref:Mucin-3A n=1 Tax=Stegastes partitus TaxID=144197 RepID=A0A9Y4KG62_9TELE|nr:PREDICTED: mucin-3A-like [Stegastes partitus]
MSSPTAVSTSPTVSPTSTVMPSSDATATVHLPSTLSSSKAPVTASPAVATSEEPTRTPAVTASSTAQCTDCQCNGGTCIFNETLGSCQCQCQDFVLGDHCSLGQDDTSANIDTEGVPTRAANLTLEINISFQDAFNDLESPESLEFIRTLERQLEPLCRQAFPQGFTTVQVIKLSPGSVVAVTSAEYRYQNNETQIQFVNTQLDGVLADILNDSRSLSQISQAFGNESVQLNGLTFQPPPVTDVSDLMPFVNCSGFANYTAEIVDGRWLCVGPCKTNPDYCHQRGVCHNDIFTGPQCTCHQNSWEQFYGPQCDLSRRGPSFYGAVFGSLGAALLLLITIVFITVMVKKKHIGSWKKKNAYQRRLSAFDDFNDFFDFSNTGSKNSSRGSEHQRRMKPTE